LARVSLIIEDRGAKSVTITTEIDGVESMNDEASPAMILAMATRAMFENGMLAEAGRIGINAINIQASPASAIRAHFNSKEEQE
jgi:hypothetical protein